MYLLRLLLMAAVLLAAYSFGLLVAAFPIVGVVALFVLLLRACRRVRLLTAYGTSRWANSSDVEHLTEGQGIILGQLLGEDK